MDRNISFHTGSLTYKLYTFIVKKRAVSTAEILEEFKNTPLKKHHLSSYLKQVMKTGLVVKSKERVQSKKRMCSRSYVYGISEKEVEKKVYFLNNAVDTDELLVGVKAKVFEIINNSKTGLTLSEVFYQIKDYPSMEDYENWDYTYQCIRELFLQNKLKRSPFMIPANNMVNGKKPGFVYGRDDDVIKLKILQLMNKEVRTAYLDIIQSNEVYPIDLLKQRYGLEEEIVKSWFTLRLVSVGWIKVFIFKQRRYYYNPATPEQYVADLVPKIHQKDVVQSILNNSSLGSAFEEQAIFYFVMYLIKRYKLQIRLNSEFPKKIPSWFNKGAYSEIY